jgi:hypothetical protein
MTIGPAKIWDSIVYAGEGFHPETHRYIHVLGLQNRVINEFDRPNAVIVPVPSVGALSRPNLIDTAPDALSAMSGPLRQMNPALGLLLPRGARGATLVTRGQYGVTFINEPQGAVVALEALPAELRPPHDRSLLAAYARWYPGWPLLLCCWQGRMHADPVVLWYEPRDPKRLFLPTLQALQGGTPQPLATVQRDVTLVVGSTIRPFGISPRRTLSSPFLPNAVWGEWVTGAGPNVDHELDVSSFRQLRNVAGKHDLHERLDPKTWSLKFKQRNPARP